VGGVIIEDHVDQLSGRDFGLDGIEEADELLMAMTPHAARSHASSFTLSFAPDP
jgi:hypothetical protein